MTRLRRLSEARRQDSLLMQQHPSVSDVLPVSAYTQRHRHILIHTHTQTSAAVDSLLPHLLLHLFKCLLLPHLHSHIWEDGEEASKALTNHCCSSSSTTSTPPSSRSKKTSKLKETDMVVFSKTTPGLSSSFFSSMSS